MKRLNRTMWLGGLCGLTLVVAGGCGAVNNKQQAYFPASEAAAVAAAADSQAAVGARADATLRPMHFDGTRLNSLGDAKLDRMMAAAADSRLTVYLDLPAADGNDARHDAVVAYLKDAGIKPDRISVKEGPNPATFTPASEGITRMSKTENPGAQNPQQSQGTSIDLTQTGTMPNP